MEQGMEQGTEQGYNTNIMRIDLGFAVLAIEKISNSTFGQEVYIGLETPSGDYQDIAAVGKNFKIDKYDKIEFTDEVSLRVWGDANDEDYTKEYIIPVYEEFKKKV